MDKFVYSQHPTDLQAHRILSQKVIRGKSKLQNSTASMTALNPTLTQTITQYYEPLDAEWVRLFKVLVQ